MTGQVFCNMTSEWYLSAVFLHDQPGFVGFGEEEVSATFLTSHLTCILSALLISVDVDLDHLAEEAFVRFL